MKTCPQYKITLVITFCVLLCIAIIAPAFDTIRIKTDYGRETYITIKNLSGAMKAYETDHGIFPPDRLSSEIKIPGLFGEGNRAPGTKDDAFRYVDGAFVRYLDGNPLNDDNPSPIKQPTQYFEFNPEAIKNPGEVFVNLEDGKKTTVQPNAPIFLNANGFRYFYNETKSSNFQAPQSNSGDSLKADSLGGPRENIIDFSTFQIYCVENEKRLQEPKKWITNFRRP